MAEISTEAEAPLWGVSAEFATPEAMVAAIEGLRGQGLGRLEAYSPVPVLDAAAALRLPNEHVYPFAVAGTLLGGSLMFTLCAWQTTQEYVFNIGGRPRFSWPYFLVPSFSFATLAGTLAVLLVLLVLNRLPRLNHPAFNIPNFSRSTQDRFFLVVEALGEDFDPATVERALGALSNRPITVSRVPR
jgi:hypothetical protein